MLRPFVLCETGHRTRPSLHQVSSFEGTKPRETPPMPSIQNDKRHWSTLSPPSEDGTRYIPTILGTPSVDTTTVANLEHE